MIAITTNSSTSVNAFDLRCLMPVLRFNMVTEGN